MIRITDLSLRTRFLLVPVLGLLLLLPSVFVVYYYSNQYTEEIVLSQDREFSQVRRMNQLGSALARNHIMLYTLLNDQASSLTEGEVYDIGKPLINEVIRLEDVMESMVNDQGLSKQELEKYIKLQQRLSKYRAAFTNSITMVSVDLNQSRAQLANATEHFNKLSEELLVLDSHMQKNLEQEVGWLNDRLINLIFSIVLALTIFITLLLVISFLATNLLSRDIKKSIRELFSLASLSATAEGQEGNEMQMLASAVDTMSHHHHELESTRSALAQSEYRLRSVFAAISDSVIMINSAGVIQQCNDATERMFGYTAAELTGRNVSVLMPEPMHSEHDSYIENYIRSGEAKVIGRTRESEGRRKDGSVFPVELSVSELWLDGERFFTAELADISLRKQQDEVIRRSQKMQALGQLTGGVAHDFSNIMNIILGFTHLLEHQVAEEPRSRELVTEINHAAQRAADLTKRLLAFARYVPAETSVIELNNMLSDSRPMIERALTSRIQLAMELADRDCWIKADPGGLENVIVNLCLNAMQATHGTGVLTLATCQQVLAEAEAQSLGLASGHYVQLIVSDTGDGMDEETRERIFEPFYTTKGEGGTGLGLSQVYAFMQSSHGAIKVISKPGEGSQFILYFPLQQPDAGAVRSQTHHYDSESLDGHETILAVDDESSMRRLMENVLAARGYRVLTAENGEQALSMLQDQSIDLLLCDVIMPGMDGYQLAANVQQLYPAVRIQLISGYAGEQYHYQDNALTRQMLHKPVDLASLLRCVRQLLDS